MARSLRNKNVLTVFVQSQKKLTIFLIKNWLYDIDCHLFCSKSTGWKTLCLVKKIKKHVEIVNGNSCKVANENLILSKHIHTCM